MYREFPTGVCENSLAIQADIDERAVPFDLMPVVKIAGGTAQLIGPIPKENAKLKIQVIITKA
jgi:hypothetical protein